MLLLQALAEGVKKQGKAAARKSESNKDMKVAKLTENDNIEATFKWLMGAYGVKKDKWTFKLAPQLVGKHSRRMLSSQSLMLVNMIN